MKSSLSLLFLILFSMPCYAFKDSKCEPLFYEEDYYTIQEFILFLVDFEIYSVADFIKLKAIGLPEGVPDKPLRVYPSLNREWSNLWRRVAKASFMKERREQVLTRIKANKTITTSEISRQTDFPLSQIQYTINQLKKENQLAYVGSPSWGHWEILEEGMEPSEEDPHKERKEQLLALIEADDAITIDEISRQSGFTSSQVQYTINQLKKEKRLARVGRSQNKVWEILKEGAEPSPDPVEQRKEQFLTLIEANKEITAAEIVVEMEVRHKTEITIHTVYYTLDRLKKEKWLARVNGKWEVLKKGAEPSSDPMERKKEEILAVIAKNDKIPIVEIAKKTELTRGVAVRFLDMLKDEERLAYVGSSRWGRWEILEKGAKPSPAPVEERKRQVLVLIEENDKITVLQMVDSIKGSTEQMIQIAIKKLIKEKKLARIGSPQSGYWKILKNGSEPLPDLIEERKGQVLALIAENNKIFTSQIAQKLELSKKTIIGIINKLKDEEKLVRVGSERWGSWKIREPSEQMLALIAKNSKITISRMAGIMRLSASLIRGLVDQLKGKELLFGEEEYWEMPEGSVVN